MSSPPAQPVVQTAAPAQPDMPLDTPRAEANVSPPRDLLDDLVQNVDKAAGGMGASITTGIGNAVGGPQTVTVVNRAGPSTPPVTAPLPESDPNIAPLPMDTAIADAVKRLTDDTIKAASSVIAGMQSWMQGNALNAREVDPAITSVVANVQFGQQSGQGIGANV